MKIYFAAALICTVSLLATSCRRPLDDISAPLNKLTLEVRIAPMIPAMTAVDVECRPELRDWPDYDYGRGFYAWHGFDGRSGRQPGSPMGRTWHRS